MKISSLLKFILNLNFKTVYFNFKYLPFKQAIKFPFKLSRNVRLVKTGGKVLINGTINTNMILVGYGDVGIFDKKNSKTIWNVSGKIIFNGYTNIGHGSRLWITGDLVLGSGFNITAESSLIVTKRVEFGKNCLLSWNILLMDTDFHKISNQQGEILNTPNPVQIGNNVWIGCRCVILKGSSIPDNCIIGANSVVTKNFSKDNAIYVGNPAQLLKENVTWTL